MRTHDRPSFRWQLAIVALATTLAACSDAGHPSSTPDGPVTSPGSPTYALAVIVFGADASSDMTYVSLFHSLDVTGLDLTTAYPFPGDADIATHGGKLYVSDGESPTIHRYSPGADGKLAEDGTVSFANLGLEQAGLRDNTFISDTKAYLTMPTGQYAIWNPDEMILGGTVDIPDLSRTGMDLDGSPAVLRGNRLYRTFYWEDWSTYTFSSEQYVGVFDTGNDTLLGMTAESRCPNLGAAAQLDEDQTIYLSNWYYNVPGTLMKGAPASCVLRIPAGTDTIDPDWSLRYSDVDGGHEGAQLSYVANGRAVFAAFHQEDFTITADTAPYEIPSSVNWEAWSVDLGTQVASAIAGIDRMVADQTVFRIDGRTFLLGPGADWASTRAYEVLPDGTARFAFPIGGWSRGFVKLN